MIAAMCLVVVLGAALGVARAETQTITHTKNFTTEDGAAVIFPDFDPSLGTLDDVQLLFSFSTWFRIEVENLEDSPKLLIMEHAYSAGFRQVEVSDHLESQRLVGRYDGVSDGGGDSGWTEQFGQTNGGQTSLPTSDYGVGLPAIFAFNTCAGVSVGPGTIWSSVSPVKFDVTVHLIYSYTTDEEPPEPEPEPSGLLALGCGMAGLTGMALKCRRR